MAVELQVSSNIISGLDVFFVDILLVSFCHLVTHALFRRLKMKKMFAEDIPDELVETSAGSLSVELLGHRPAAVILVLNSVLVAALALITGFGITGKDGVELGQTIELLHADLSHQPFNVSNLDNYVIAGEAPNRKTLWGSVFEQRNECLQKNMTHDKIIRMATTVTKTDSSEDGGIWPPRSTDRVCLDPALYVDANKAKPVVSESVLYAKRRYEIESIGDCHLFYEGSAQKRVSQEGRGVAISDMFIQPILLRNCVSEEVKLESFCAKGIVTACITNFTTPKQLDLVILATWDKNAPITESEPEWRNMVLTDVTRSDNISALTLSTSQKWNVAQIIAGRYATTLNEAVLVSNSALTNTTVQAQENIVALTSLSVGLLFVPLGLIFVDISVLLLALAKVKMELRRRGVVDPVNVAADTKELLSLLKEIFSPLETDQAKMLLRPSRKTNAQTGSKTEFLLDAESKLKAHLDALHSYHFQN